MFHTSKGLTMENQEIGKNAVILTIAKMITILIALVSSMLLSRFRTLEEYGTYSQLLIVINLVTSLFTLGLPNSTNYFLARAENLQERKQFLSVYYSLNTILCFVMGIVLACSVPLIVSYFNNPLIRSFIYVLILLPWTKVIISSISNVLVVYGKTKKLTLLNTVNAATALVAILIVEIFQWSFQEYMFLYLLGEMGIMIWVYGIVMHLEGHLSFSLNKIYIIKIFQYSIPIGIASFIGTISLELDKLMIGRLMNTEAVAIYTNAGKELPLTIVASSLTAVLLPQMARSLKKNETEKAVTLWGFAIELSYICICFFSMICIVFAPQIMTILYSEKYLSGISVFQIYSLVLLLRTTYFGIILNSIGKTKFILYSSALSLVLNCALNVLFFYLFGFTGPAWATLLSIVAAGIVQLIVTSKTIHINFRLLFPWKKLFYITFVNVGLGSITFFTLQYCNIGINMKDLSIAVLIGLICMGIYIILMRKKVMILWRKLNHETENK